MAVNYYFPVLFREFIDSFLDRKALFLAFEMLAWVVGIVGDLEFHLAIAGIIFPIQREDFDPLLAEIVDRAIGRDLVQPGRKTELRAVGSQRRKGLHKGILHEVVGCLGVPNDFVGDMVNRRLMAFGKNTVGLLVAFQGAGNQFCFLVAQVSLSSASTTSRRAHGFNTSAYNNAADLAEQGKSPGCAQKLLELR